MKYKTRKELREAIINLAYNGNRAAAELVFHANKISRLSFNEYYSIGSTRKAFSNRAA